MKNSLHELVRRTGGRGIRDQKKSDGDGFDRNNVFAGSAVGSFEFADGSSLSTSGINVDLFKREMREAANDARMRRAA